MAMGSGFSGAVLLTLTQALQLTGLIPSLFLVAFLLALSHRNRQTLIPALYFLALACSFALPLADIYPPSAQQHGAKLGLLFGESLLVAFNFLLVLQFILNRVPPWRFWLVLAIPLIGGGGLLYAALLQMGEQCVDCIDVISVKAVYNILGSALIFLLLIYYSAQHGGMEGEKKSAGRQHKYWLMISLIALNLFMLSADLARLAGRLSLYDAEFIVTLLKLTFIYLVITSLFRVFYPSLVGEMAHFSPLAASAYHPEQEKPHVDAIMALLEGEHVYREMRLNRALFAQKVGISEHHLSHVVNRHFQKSVSELINSYRIDDAKRRLRAEPQTAITTIAFETGFNSIASFNRVFKSKTGTSPSRWRGGAGAAD